MYVFALLYQRDLFIINLSREIPSIIIYIHIAKIEIVINTQINYQKIRSSCISQLYALTSSKSDFFSCLTIKFKKG